MRFDQYEVVDLTELNPYRERLSTPPFELDYRLVLHKDDFVRLLREVKRACTLQVPAFSGKTPKESERQQAFESQLLFRGYHAHFLDMPDERAYEKGLPFRRYALHVGVDPAEVDELLSGDLLNEIVQKFMK